MVKHIEIRTCSVCGGSYRADEETGLKYPIYDAPEQCTCADVVQRDANQVGFDVVKRATEGR